MSEITRDLSAGLPSRSVLLAFGIAAVVALAVGAAIAPRAAAWGWLAGFLIFSSAPIGAIALTLIQELTGGRWGEAFAPTLRLGALCSPLLPIAFLAVLAGLPILYPWAAHGAPIAPDVARLYLNPGAFAARGLVMLLGWATIGVLAASGRLGALGAAVALVCHGVAVSFTAIDWGLSFAIGYADSAFGAEIAVQQIMLALALVAVLQPQRAIALAGGDLGGLLLATSLGAAYLGAMTFVVKWYGDQPIDAAWWLARAHGRELVFLIGASLFGAAAPILTCGWERVRNNPRAMRAVGAAAIVGIALHDLWLLGPEAPALAVAAAALTLVAMASLSTVLALQLGPRLSRATPIGEAAS